MSNPFASSYENPFEDATIQAAVTHTSSSDYPVRNETPKPAIVSVGDDQASSPSLESSVAPPVSSSTRKAAARAQEELVKQQKDLERKAEEIRRREEMLNGTSTTNVRANNWPPLPKCCCVQPCFYQDINIEIPLNFQNVVRRAYMSWIFYSSTLLLNVIGSIAYFAIGANSAAAQFGLSIFQLVLFTPCSFVLWYRPLYKAFKNDSSMNFMVFFFIQFSQVICTGVLTVGIPGWSCGFISAVDAITRNIPVGSVMFTVGAFFLINFLIQLYLLIKVHRFYRTSGASMAKAQQEFGRDVASNSHIQQAAAGMASEAVRSAANRNQGY